MDGRLIRINPSNHQVDLENEELRKKAMLNALSESPDAPIAPLLELTKDIHLSWIFLPIKGSRELLQKFCLSFSSAPPNSRSSFVALSCNLGLQWQVCDVITHCQLVIDKTELVLKTFAQKRDSTLGVIIHVLSELQRYDVITKTEPLIKSLVSFINSPEGLNLWDQACRTYHYNNDSGFEDGVDGSKIITPKDWKSVLKDLITPLREIVQSDNVSVLTMNEAFQQAVPVHEGLSHSSDRMRYRHAKTILLTFANDGRDAAIRIAAKLRSQSNGRTQYGVLMLDEYADEVMSNPTFIITNLFKMVHYVMPILTHGYFNNITKKKDFSEYDASSSLDDKYVLYIYNLIENEYCENACFNKRFMCIIPEELSHRDISNHLSCRLSFRTWNYEKTLDAFAKRFLN